MDYPAAVVEKAKCLESLLQRVEAGEPFEPVLAELGLQVKANARCWIGTAGRCAPGWR